MIFALNTDVSKGVKYLSVFPQMAIQVEIYQSMSKGESSNLLPAACLIGTWIAMIFIYKKIDAKLNQLNKYVNPFDVELDLPEVNESIHQELLENEHDREYDPYASTLKSKIKQTMTSVAQTFKGKEDVVNESVVERRTESRVIRMKNVTCLREQIPIFYNFSATFMSNRINTIVGKNGSGKTEIFRLLSGFDIPKTGNMYLDNLKLLCSEEYHQGQVAYASVDTIPFPEMTVSDYYRYLSIFKSMLYETIEQDIDVTLKKLGIRHLKDQRISTLSLGDKRKVSIGSVNIGENIVILIDEPFDGIDAGGRRRI